MDRKEEARGEVMERLAEHLDFISAFASAGLTYRETTAGEIVGLEDLRDVLRVRPDSHASRAMRLTRIMTEAA